MTWIISRSWNSLKPVLKEWKWWISNHFPRKDLVQLKQPSINGWPPGSFRMMSSSAFPSQKLGFHPPNIWRLWKRLYFLPPRIACFYRAKFPPCFKLSKIPGTKKTFEISFFQLKWRKLSFGIGRNAYLPSTASNKNGKIFWTIGRGNPCVLVAYEGSKKTNLKSAVKVLVEGHFLRKNLFALNLLPGSLRVRAPENRRSCNFGKSCLSPIDFQGLMWVSPVVITGFLTISRMTTPPPENSHVPLKRDISSSKH